MVQEDLFHKHPSVSVLGPSIYFDVAHVGVDGEVFHHGLVGVKDEAPELRSGGFSLGKVHQVATNPSALFRRINGNVLDEQAVASMDERDESDDGLSGHPDGPRFDSGVVVTTQRSWREVHPTKIFLIGSSD